MSKLQKNQAGFGAVGGLLIFVIVAIIGFTGWYVWHAKSNTDKALTANNSSTPSFKKKATPAKVPAQTADPAAKWQVVTSGKGAFSIKIPDGWQITKPTAYDNLFSRPNEDSITYKAGTPAVITVTDGAGNDAPIRFSASATSGDTQTLRGDQVSFGPVDGITGIRYHYVETGTPFGVGLQQGDQEYDYYFIKGAMKYLVFYRINSTDTNRLDLIDQVVKTLKFN